jgi:DNA-binding NarL/FixJ family response regulator
LNTTQRLKPRVLLADDHVAFLEAAIDLLYPACDVVGLASDGRQALEMAKDLRPEVVVLDVSMPKLNGFQTLEHLRRDLPDTRVIFCTLHGMDEIVAAALNAGAHGYVLKSRIHVDLTSAIEHALADRLFVPSLASLRSVAANRHTLVLHAENDRFLEDVCQLVGPTLRSGDPVVVVTCEATRVGIAQCLRGRHINPSLVADRGQYVEQDSAAALSHVMRDGSPDQERLMEMIHDFDGLRLSAPNGLRSRLTIVADLTVALWRGGEFEAAVALERIWNELTRTFPFSTVCVIPTDCFARSEAGLHFPTLCDAHSAVTVGASYSPRITHPR